MDINYFMLRMRNHSIFCIERKIYYVFCCWKKERGSVPLDRPKLIKFQLFFMLCSLLRQCAPLGNVIREDLSSKQPEAYEWFWSHQHAMVVTTYVNLFESDPRFADATVL